MHLCAQAADDDEMENKEEREERNYVLFPDYVTEMRWLDL